ncbi:MAG TPA: hypothetical protein VL993_09590 [Stellaceae bacterium]|nr:hypothetical protein [Stellaceae bacterium]
MSAKPTRTEWEALATHARTVAECGAALAATGGIVAAALGGDTAEVDWRHYPPGDISDPRSCAQYFYHAHPPGERGSREQGHFHTFLRARGIPDGVRPLVLPELAIAGSPAAPDAPSAPEGQDGDIWCHLIAIAMDARGTPVRLFTTNRWVTGETWHRAADVTTMLDRFVVAPAAPAPLLNRWITAMVGLYRPQIATLLEARDKAVMDWRRRRRAKVHVFEDRRLEVASALEIDVARHVREIEAALATIPAE